MVSDGSPFATPKGAGGRPNLFSGGFASSVQHARYSARCRPASYRLVAEVLRAVRGGPRPWSSKSVSRELCYYRWLLIGASLSVHIPAPTKIPRAHFQSVFCALAKAMPDGSAVPLCCVEARSLGCRRALKDCVERAVGVGPDAVACVGSWRDPTTCFSAFGRGLPPARGHCG